MGKVSGALKQHSLDSRHCTRCSQPQGACGLPCTASWPTPARQATFSCLISVICGTKTMTREQMDVE